ncbi:MAG: hypothetical protein LBT64_03500 [Puniceicoccales bacterium]|jgi:hypothetical protein|nr:hypothetical protein [Puniceicoccales bacterium]
MESHKIDQPDSDAQIRAYAESHPDGHVTIETDKEKQTIMVNHCVVEYCAKKKDSLKKQLMDSALYDRAAVIIEQFEAKPFAFSGHAMVDRMHEYTSPPSNIKLVYMGDERIRRYGLFHFMLEILQSKVHVSSDDVRTLRKMMDWMLFIMARDNTMPSQELDDIKRCLLVLPHSS